MAAKGTLRTEDIAALRRLFTKRTDKTANEREARWLAVRSGIFRAARPLKDYHDLLLFILAFPANAQDSLLAGAELERVAALVADLCKRNATMHYALMNSGISGSASCATFGIDLSRWLSDAVEGGVLLDSLSGDDALARNVLLASTLSAEAEAMDDAGHDVHARIIDACGRKEEALRWLLNAVQGIAPSPQLQHVLWEVLKPMLMIDAPGSVLTRTFCRGLSDQSPACVAEFTGSVNVQHIIRTPLPSSGRSTERERVQLVNAARGILVGHLRETDTATLCDPSAVEWQDLGQGMGVVLLPLPPGRRTAFDSYVGYVAFSNSVPVAYGGAWVFPGKSKVGLNVFPAFRGGPSMLLFARILQCYAQRYDVECFEAESYQLGHGNPDGIRSGAYWFYYRAGFRTVDPGMAALAEEERARMEQDRSYRTAPSLLRRLVSGSMRLRLEESAAPEFEPSALSDAVLRSMALIRNGDRSAGLRHCTDHVQRVLGVEDMRSWPALERQAFSDLSPALALINGLESWTIKEKGSLVALMRAKGLSNENEYIRRLREHHRLLDAWAAIANAE
ncbi:MAG: hypothetical protein IPO90_17420 [Flavobacteriales bacterium]|nr:hypothetical protein [Flavobacteriales bacterium]